MLKTLRTREDDKLFDGCRWYCRMFFNGTIRRWDDFFVVKRQWLRHISPHRNPLWWDDHSKILGVLIKADTCTGLPRKWVTASCLDLISEPIFSIASEAGQLFSILDVCLKKQYSNTAYRYIQEIVPPRFAIVPAPMCVMHIISTVDFAIRVLRSCCVSCHASQFDSGGGSYDQQIGDTFLRPPVLVGTFTRIEQFKLPSGKLT